MQKRDWPPKEELEFYDDDGDTYQIEIVEIRPKFLRAETIDRQPNLRLLLPPRYSTELRDLVDLASIQIGQRGTASLRTNPENHRPLGVDVILNKD